MSLRNSVAVAAPLAIAIALGHPLGGIALATGALNVAYSDGNDPYAHRARRMFTWSFIGAFAVFLGSITGNYPVLAVATAAGWAFVAGLMVAISTRAGDLGLNTLVTVIVYGARGALSPSGAAEAGLLVLGGGLFQTALALAFWPKERNRPERRAIGRVYRELAQQAASDSTDLLAVPLATPSSEVQDTLAALGREHSAEGERLRLLLDQADRLRFSIYTIRTLQSQLAGLPDPAGEAFIVALDQMLSAADALIACFAETLLEDRDCNNLDHLLAAVNNALDRIHDQPALSPAVQSVFSAADVLAGQLRVTSQLANSTTTAGAADYARRELAPPWNLQMRSWFATLRANLYLSSPAFRHAVRLTVCVAAGDILGRSIGNERNYWIAMTVAVVLKPDFASTFSRGVLRLAGTFAGLTVATLLYHFLPASPITELLLAGLFTFLMRYAGPANYGVFTLAISGLIVSLIAETGIAPASVVLQRAVNTTAGGLFALLAYALWPTWERSHVSEVMAEMFDKMRDYFHAIGIGIAQGGRGAESSLDRARSGWRAARSAAEASVDRLSTEPRVEPAKLALLTSMLASSHASARAMMGMEARMTPTAKPVTSPELEAFCRDVEFTLYFLAAALRGSAGAAQSLPALREDYRRLLQSARASHLDDWLLTETDRLTVALNTLREQVMRLVGEPSASSAGPLHTTMK